EAKLHFARHIAPFCSQRFDTPTGTLKQLDLLRSCAYLGLLFLFPSLKQLDLPRPCACWLEELREHRGISERRQTVATCAC
ncbi:hypothetical protein OFN32_33075, partial [Escherichia coli]|nr:hypothetical protein [Escherichia coli]